VHSGDIICMCLYMVTNNKKQMAGWFRGSTFFSSPRAGGHSPMFPPLPVPLEPRLADCPLTFMLCLLAVPSVAVARIVVYLSLSVYQSVRAAERKQLRLSTRAWHVLVVYWHWGQEVKVRVGLGEKHRSACRYGCTFFPFMKENLCAIVGRDTCHRSIGGCSIIGAGSVKAKFYGSSFLVTAASCQCVVELTGTSWRLVTDLLPGGWQRHWEVIRKLVQWNLALKALNVSSNDDCWIQNWAAAPAQWSQLLVENMVISYYCGALWVCYRRRQIWFSLLAWDFHVVLLTIRRIVVDLAVNKLLSVRTWW